MTHEEHVALARTLHPVHQALTTAYITTSNKLGKTSRAAELLKRMNNVYSEVKAELDTLYHAATTEEQFAEHGHVYYGKKGE